MRRALVKTDLESTPSHTSSSQCRRGHWPEDREREREGGVDAWLKFMGAVNHGELDEFWEK